MVMNTSQLLLHPLKSNIIHDLLAAFDFPAGVIRQVSENLQAQAGTSYHSPSHILVFDRENFSIKKIPDGNYKTQIWIQAGDKKINAESSVFHFELIPPLEEIFKNRHSHILFADSADLVSGAQRWAHGRAVPCGEGLSRHAGGASHPLGAGCPGGHDQA